ncbi:MAG: glycine cleavage system protein GcvH [Deltaproteobacteria bacterium]|nr:MAG: glycine cleavage system protein GcvH [Deltaproteobacteria bacterium]
MEFPDNLRYTKEHEWVRVDDDGTVLVGITDYAQDQLGDIVYVELPDVDEEEPVSKDEPLAVVESVKAVSDVYAPVTGTVTEINDELPNSPEVINQDPYGDGWMVRMKPENEEELDELLTAEEYEALVNELS